MSIWERLFRPKKAKRPERVMPPRPEGWALTTDDLFAEMKAGKRARIEGAELAWAKEYERELLPPDTHFPRKGEVYEVREDMTVDYLTAWAAPFSGGGKGTLFRGEQVWIHVDPGEERPVLVYALPKQYEAVERRMVPEEQRTAPKYGGFYLALSTKELNEKFVRKAARK